MNTFMIIDDDVSVVKMISTLIRKNHLGKVVEELYCSEHAIEEILFYNPDILLIDYLMHPMDGVFVTQEIRKKGYKGQVIMISQVEADPMRSKAYNNGVHFFISKPINAIEVVKVIKNVSHSIELERSLEQIKSALSRIEGADAPLPQSKGKSVKDILGDLGIIAESGAADLIRVIEKVKELKEKNPSETYRLHDIYQEIIGEKKEFHHSVSEKDRKSFEQRIRRTVQKALENLAQIGIDDYYNPVFSEYASLIFDLKQVKQEMKYVEGLSKDRGGINIKKFIEGIVIKINM